MRLLLCTSCEEVLTLKENDIKTCRCGKVSGVIEDGIVMQTSDGFSYDISADRFHRNMHNEIDYHIKELVQTQADIDRIFYTKVIEYLNSNADTDFKTKFPSSASKEILARKKEYDLILSDFFKVIDKKCKEWLGTPYDKYLRPMTLFNKTKFENYIGELNGKQSAGAAGKVLNQFASTVHAAKK